MAVKSGFFMSVNGDRRYDAAFFAEYFASFIGNGVFPNPSTNLQVVEGNNMQTVVKLGKGWINGYYVHNDSDFIIQHDVADGVLKRIDRIVLQWSYLSRKIDIVLKKGAFASTPVAPALVRNTDYYELVLADVLINNGATRIVQVNITDQRLNKALCGIVHGVVNQVDTTTLFNQYQSWFNQTSEQKLKEINDFQLSLETSANQWLAQEQADFEDWFATLQNLLDENIAATLTAKVQALETSKANQTDLVNLNDVVTTHLAQKGEPNGYAILDASGKVPTVQLPSMDYVPKSEKGIANGIASLGPDGKVPQTQLDIEVSYTDLTFEPGDFNIYNDDNVVSKASVSYEKTKKVVAQTKAKVRVTFGLYGSGNGSSYWGRIYINDVALGIERKISSSRETLYTEDFDVNAGDEISLYLRSYSTGVTTFSQTFKIGILGIFG